MTIFVDNDVILDVLLERKDFRYSQTLLSLIEKKQVVAFTSPLIFTNSFYVVSKIKSKKAAWSALQKIRLLFKVTTVSQKSIDQALASSFTDFEDAVQYYAALNKNVDFLVTRNKKDYESAEIAVVNPQEFLAILDLS